MRAHSTHPQLYPYFKVAFIRLEKCADRRPQRTRTCKITRDIPEQIDDETEIDTIEDCNFRVLRIDQIAARSSIPNTHTQREMRREKEQYLAKVSEQESEP